MKTPFVVPALAALLLAVPPAHASETGPAEKTVPAEQVVPAEADPPAARAALAKEGIAFTPEAFLQKVAAGDAANVAQFLQAGIDPTVSNNRKRTALWIAVEQKQPEVLKALLAGGVAPDEKNAPPMEYGKTIVFEAVDSGDAGLVRALVEAGADAKKANEYGVPPLAEAARTGRLEMCAILLKGGADPNAAPAGFPLLYGPVNEDHLDVVQLLLGAGAKLGEHKAPLIEAAKTPEMRALLEAAE